MRILTVRQPWAWAIIHGGKDVENRVRNVAGSYRGPVLIHAAQQWDDLVTDNDSWEAVLDAMKDDGSDPFDAPWQTQRGVIIGVVDLTDAHLADTCEQWIEAHDRCSEWADAEGWHLVLANPRPLVEPIPYKGALGLRRLDDETIARIEGAIA
ncbi:ASCH domain-containing protein [Microbacterium sp.]|uniref:ASCH domain-containing protein n=1 Tax=Microbacterium sp. TaxID=51671 RepID=UPI003A93642E